MTKKTDAVAEAPLFAQTPPEEQPASKPARKTKRKETAPSQEIVSKGELQMAPAAAPPILPGAAANQFLETLQAIERMASNANVDADKLGKILDMQERILDRQARDAFDAALMRAKATLPIITKDARISFGGKSRTSGDDYKLETQYATWSAIRKVVDPILFAEGLVLTHRLETGTEIGQLRVRAVLKGHGYTDDSCYIDLAPDPTGSKNAVQAKGSSLLYGERYTGCAVLGIATRDDDDGAASGKPLTVGDPMSPEQADQLTELLLAVRLSPDKLLKFLNGKRPKGHPEANEIAYLPSFRFEEAIAVAREYEAEVKKRVAEKTGAKK